MGRWVYIDITHTTHHTHIHTHNFHIAPLSKNHKISPLRVLKNFAHTKKYIRILYFSVILFIYKLYYIHKSKTKLMKNKNLILLVVFALLGVGLLMYNITIGYFCLAAAIHYLVKLFLVKPKNLLTLGLVLTAVTLVSCDKEPNVTVGNKKETLAKKSSNLIDDEHLQVIMNSTQYDQLGRPDLTNAMLVESKEHPGVYQVLIELRDNEQATFLINDVEAYPVNPLVVIYEPDQHFVETNGPVFSSQSETMFSGTITVRDLNGDIKHVYTSDGNGQFHPVLGNSVRSCTQYLLSTVEFFVLTLINPWSALGTAITSCILYDALGWL